MSPLPANKGEKVIKSHSNVSLATAVDSIAEGLLVHDTNGIIQFCNSAAERILGYEPSELIGLTTVDRVTLRSDGSEFPLEDSPTSFSLRSADTVSDLLMGIQHPDGELIWVNISTVPLIHPGQSSPSGVVVTLQDITDKKRADDARTRLAAIVDTSHDAIVSATLDATIVSWNGGAERLFGYVSAEIIGNSITALAAADDHLIVLSAFKQLIRTGTVEGREVVCSRKDGSTMEVLLGLSMICDDAGKTIGVSAIIRDISDRKAAETALWNSRRSLADAQRMARVGSWEVDLVSGQTDWSDEIFRICGLDRELGAPDMKSVIGIFHPDDAIEYAVEIRRLIDEGVPFESDKRLQLTNGDIRHVHVRGNRILSQINEPIRLFGTMADITERKQSEDALKRAEENYRGIFEHAIDGIFQTTLTGRVLQANHALARMLGYGSSEELITCVTYLETHVYVDPEERRSLINELQENGQVKSREMQFRKKDGSIVWVSMNARIVTRQGTGDRCLEGMIEDITARRVAESKVSEYSQILQSKMQELAAANANLEALATSDGLTGIKNHRAFQEAIAEEFKRALRYKLPLSLLLLDVDQFKQYNDGFGHPAGDFVLKRIAVILGDCTRSVDMVARYGGEEFVVILPQTDKEGSLVTAERIRSAVEETEWPNRAVTVSVGAVTLITEISSVETMISFADQALYHSKSGGRNRVTHSAAIKKDPGGHEESLDPKGSIQFAWPVAQ